jgi:short-subunit dehydrogenase
VRAEVLPADLTDRSVRSALPARVAELGLAVSILVNNAGLSTTGPVLTAWSSTAARPADVR